jgi:hypothetical protein
MGTFGEKQRRVLCLHPDCFSIEEDDNAIPLLALHQNLEEVSLVCAKIKQKEASFVHTCYDAVAL